VSTTMLYIDGDIILYKVCWAVQKEVEWDDGELTLYSDMKELKDTFNIHLTNLLEKTGYDKYTICLSDHENNFRKKIFPDYKANRKSKMKPLGYKKLEDHLIVSYCTRFMQDLEADDVVGIMMTRFPGGMSASIDKDMLTIPGTHYNMDTEYKFGIDINVANFHFYKQVLTGDAVDNYKGCPGIGVKRALDLLEEPLTDKEYWEVIVAAYNKAGLTEEDAITQARMARILRNDDYDYDKQEVKLWEPSKK